MAKIAVSLFLCLAIILIQESASQGHIAGGFTKLSVKDKTVSKIAKFAVAKYNQAIGKTYALLSINSAKSQIVAGTLYDINVTVKQSNCHKLRCKRVKCNFTVVVQYWLNSTKLTNYRCA